MSKKPSNSDAGVLLFTFALLLSLSPITLFLGLITEDKTMITLGAIGSIIYLLAVCIR